MIRRAERNGVADPFGHAGLPERDAVGIDRGKWWTLAVVGASTFMSALDTSIVNIALPSLARSTGAPMSTIEWVILSYLLSVTSSLVLFGRLSDMVGKRTMYLTGQIVFGLGSLLCGVVGSIGFLVAARALQGLGAAMLFAVGPALLTSTFPPHERGRALGMQATMTYLGLSTGPALGGMLTQHLGWHSIFLVNVPVALAACLFASRVLKPEAHKPQAFDFVGAGLVALALTALLLAFTKMHSLGPRAPLVVALLAVSGMAWLALFHVERRLTAPALDVRLFSNLTFSASALAALLCYAASAAANLLMPFLLLRGLGLRESHAGALLMATPVAMMIVTGPSGALSDRIGVRLPSTLGMGIMALGAVLLTQLGSSATDLSVAVATFVMGLGAGLFTVPNNSALMSAAPPSQRGVAGAVLAASRTTGFSLGAAIAAFLYASALGTQGYAATPKQVAHAVHQGMFAVVVLCLGAAVLSAVRKGETKP